MKKNLVKLLLAGLLVFGVLCFMGCKIGDDEEKSIKITGLSKYNDDTCAVRLENGDGDGIAETYNATTVEDGSIRCLLYEMDSKVQWTGSGDYYVVIGFWGGDHYRTTKTVSFNSDLTTVDLSSFYRITDY